MNTDYPLHPDLNSKPTITVLMTVYNGENYCAEAIESILRQSWKDFEFLIIDDGSTDRTSEILQYFVSLDKRIKIHTQKNQGLTATLNRGIEMAQGTYIARQDADDVSHLRRLELQLAMARQYNADLILSDYEVCADTTTKILYTCFPSQMKFLWARFILFGNKFAHTSYFFRRSDSLRYDPGFKFAQDLELLTRLWMQKRVIKIVPKVLVTIRHHEKSISRVRRQEQKENSRRIIKMYYGCWSPLVLWTRYSFANSYPVQTIVKKLGRAAR